MRNITDQLFVFLVKRHLFLCVCLQTEAHLLKILTELPDLIIRILLDLKIQVSLADIARRLLKLRQRNRYAPVDPVDQKPGSQKYDHKIHLLYLIYPLRRKCLHCH